MLNRRPYQNHDLFVNESTTASRVDLLGNIAIRTSHRNPTPHLPTRWCMAANRLVAVELRSLSSVYHCQGLLLRRCRIP